MKKILFYGVDGKRLHQYQDIGAENNIEIRSVGDDGLHTAMSRLFEMEDDLPDYHKEFQQEFMIIQNMKKEEVLNLLNEFSGRNIPYNGIKVMSTENNAKWTLEKMLTFAQQESEKAVEAVKLKQLVESCNGIDLTSINEAQAYEFRKALSNASKLINNRNSSLESLENASQKLSEAKKGARKLLN